MKKLLVRNDVRGLPGPPAPVFPSPQPKPQISVPAPPPPPVSNPTIKP